METTIIELYEQGLTVSEIARKLSLKSPYVYERIKRGLFKRKRGQINEYNKQTCL